VGNERINTFGVEAFLQVVDAHRFTAIRQLPDHGYNDPVRGEVALRFTRT
jgi:hypothetical protein